MRQQCCHQYFKIVLLRWDGQGVFGLFLIRWKNPRKFQNIHSNGIEGVGRGFNNKKLVSFITRKVRSTQSTWNIENWVPLVCLMMIGWRCRRWRVFTSMLAGNLNGSFSSPVSNCWGHLLSFAQSADWAPEKPEINLSPGKKQSCPESARIPLSAATGC